MREYQNDMREWLETDGAGGFASGTVCGMRTRRYHALVLVATRPPAGRVVLVNGFDAWVETPAGTFPISTQSYAGAAVWPGGHEHLADFKADPWPTWDFSVGGIIVRQELFVPRDVAGVALRWSVEGDGSGSRLHLRPFLSGRDYHGLHRENPDFRFDDLAGERAAGESGHAPFTRLAWQPYADLPVVFAEANATCEVRPEWYRRFDYAEERRRGLDHVEDLGSPGEFHWNLENASAVLLLGAGKSLSEQSGRRGLPPERVFFDVAARERERRTAIDPLNRAADAYVARRGGGATVIAGYPWFTDWGRDTFIAMRGLALSPHRLPIAGQILMAWSGTVSDGMLPNRFPDQGDEPEYNSVDASLWYIVAAHDYLVAMKRHGRTVPAGDRAAITAAIHTILSGYARGTRYGIRLDGDGLLAAGQPGVQLTWMDAKVGDWVVTPRIGKPVEVQALWLNALWIGARFRPVARRRDGGSHPDWSRVLERGRTAFLDRFESDIGGALYDVVDVDHQSGAVDGSFRPNQIFAAGGLPLQILDGARARRVVDAVEQRLLTPLGLRSLDPNDPAYHPRYEGGVRERDGAYHQGTVWPWLMGPFVEAWVRVRGGTNEAKQEARRRFIEPLVQHMNQAGLGHISEIADGDPPHRPRGCPFQAWSLGELLRVERDVLSDDPDAAAPSDSCDISFDAAQGACGVS